MPAGYIPNTRVSVIIAIRNEGSGILKLLKNLQEQNYPAHLYQVIIIDDHSEDNSAGIISDFKQTTGLNINLITLSGKSETTGKKAAVAAGIAAATGELLVFTDGDCRVQPEWLLYTEFLYTAHQAKFISGPVTYQNPDNLFKQMQLLEFASLIGIGGSSIALGKPNMCNGANMAYPKKIFYEVAGFKGNEHIPSGDDEFIMHKVQQLYRGQVYFLKARKAIVFTDAKPDLPGFLAQRIRWASKWPAYRVLRVKLLALLVFTVNLFLFAGIILAVSGWVTLKALLWAMGAKILIDILFMAPVLKFFRKINYLFLILPLQLIYIPYVVITALAGLRGTYNWKGRQIKSKI